LTSKFGDRPQARIAAEQSSGFGESENSQRARSLLFMGAAALIAGVAGFDEVYINENGVMAVHVPLTTARFGSLSTKTAYPPIVESVASIASAALGATSLRIDNRLVCLTKPEVVAEAKGVGVEGGLSSTASCWTWQRKRQHCGVCAPCLMRRISFELEKIGEAPYIANPFDDASAVMRDFARDNMSHLCQVVEEIRGMTDFDFELDHPEILDGGKMITAPEARDLYRRWASQAHAVLSAHPVSKKFLSAP
jgi:hypothetical protein